MCMTKTWSLEVLKFWFAYNDDRATNLCSGMHSLCYYVTLSFGVNVRENQMTSRMDNSEILGTLGTDDTGRRQTKHKDTTQQDTEN
jgi:hypothetical protein